jgi:hypothetical protein
MLLVLGGLAVYRVDTRPHRPHFAVGGGFAAAGAGPANGQASSVPAATSVLATSRTVTPQGVVFTFEGGQVQFGPVSQVNQGTYTPPMLQIPAPLTAGNVQHGKTQVYSGSSVERVEDWTVTILGGETVAVGNASIPTVKVQVDRQSEPGPAQQTTRHTTFWYDPSQRVWIKFYEKENGSQTVLGLNFTYSDELTATLASFTPAA